MAGSHLEEVDRSIIASGEAALVASQRYVPTIVDSGVSVQNNPLGSTLQRMFVDPPSPGRCSHYIDRLRLEAHRSALLDACLLGPGPFWTIAY